MHHGQVSRFVNRQVHWPPARLRTVAAAAGVDQSADPSSRARSSPFLSMIRLVGRPRACHARAAAPFGSSSTGNPVIPCSW